MFRFTFSVGDTTRMLYNYYGERKIELETLNTTFRVVYANTYI